jgi:hypothetical protein
MLVGPLAVFIPEAVAQPGTVTGLPPILASVPSFEQPSAAEEALIQTAALDFDKKFKPSAAIVKKEYDEYVAYLEFLLAFQAKHGVSPLLKLDIEATVAAVLFYFDLYEDITGTEPT